MWTLLDKMDWFVDTVILSSLDWMKDSSIRLFFCFWRGHDTVEHIMPYKGRDCWVEQCYSCGKIVKWKTYWNSRPNIKVEMLDEDIHDNAASCNR